MKERIAELELRYTEQQRMLQELSDVVYAQGRAVERLELEVSGLSKKLAAVEPGLVEDTSEEQPPSY